MIEYYKEILVYVQRLSGDKELSRDLTQETYAKAFRLKIHEKIKNKRAYLYKIAKHLVFDETRKKQKFNEIVYKEEYHEIPQAEHIEEILEQKAKNILLLKCIKKLPKRNKEAFYLHVIEGYSRKEIAIKMDITVSAVEKNIKRATIKIQKELEEEGVQDDY